MPAAVSYPGVYIEEVPSGVRTITGVATSIAAFVDNFSRGDLNTPVQIFSMADFEREFGGLHSRSEASYGVQQFFLNGGTNAWVVRAASGSFASASVQIQSSIGGGTALTVTARNPGEWGNGLRIGIEYPDPDTSTTFNLTASLLEAHRGRMSVAASEIFRNLTMTSGDTRFVETVVNDGRSGSKLVHVAASGSDLPQLTGTLSGKLDAFPDITAADPQVDVKIGTEGTATAHLADVPTSLLEARRLLEEAIRAADPGRRAFAEASVVVAGERLRVLAGPTEPSMGRVTFAAGGVDPTGADLGLIGAETLDGVMSADVSSVGWGFDGQVYVTIGSIPQQTLTLGTMNDLVSARQDLETQIREADAAAEFANARVVLHSEASAQRLIVLAGAPGASVTVANAGPDTTAAKLKLKGGAAIKAAVSSNLSPVPSVNAGAALDVEIGGVGPYTATFTANFDTLADIAGELQAVIRTADQTANPANRFTKARVADYGVGTENLLVVLAGVAGDTITFTSVPADTLTVGELQLEAGDVQANVQSYAVGANDGQAIPDTAQGDGEVGNMGDPPNALDLIGSLNAKTGLHALEDVDLFNILCLPRISITAGADAMSDTDAATVISAANTYCEKRRAFFIVDTPGGIDELPEITAWANNTLPRHRNAALYYPRVLIPDPLDDFRLRSVGASGTIAGLFPRTDSARGVWKAPAGTDAKLRNVMELEDVLTDPENGVLNPLAINCLRNFPVYGNIAWGARTLVGSDQEASEWKYIPVRRLALFLEESLYRGTQWVVFEPNDEPLWSQIRLNVGAFMHQLFRQGAFQGQTPKEAYLVKCDSETTTQNDINSGIVNIVVGFAPLKPAEFVIIKIQQLAGQIQT